jgi:solute carrier family 25 phosphate transporter 3
LETGLFKYLNFIMSDTHDLTYYRKCTTGGMLACGLTHTAIVSLDLIKCRKQINPGIYSGITDGFKKIKQ